jgi:hypothetical protein
VIDGQRRALHVLLSDEALHGLRTYAERHGMSVSALLEAIGILMSCGVDENLRNADLSRMVVDTARTVDVKRRARARVADRGPSTERDQRPTHRASQPASELPAHRNGRGASTYAS